MISLLSSPEMLAQIVGLILVLLLPLLPAILIYLIIPKNVAEGTGPFQGLKIKVGGGFGAYLLTALLAFWVFRFITHNSLKEVVSLKSENTRLTEEVKNLNTQLTTLQVQLKDGALEVWTVSGSVDLAPNEHALPRSRISISVKPPPSIKSNGHFRFGVLMPTRKMGITDYPSIVFEMAGYQQDEISLDPAAKVLGGQTQYEELPAQRHFALRKVTLNKEDKPYNPEALTSAEAPKSVISKP